MKLVINHQTQYHYAAWARRSTQYIRLTPQSLGHQTVLSWQLAATGVHLTQTDGFGNLFTSLSIAQPHQQLLIMAQGEVQIYPMEGIEDNRLSPMFFTHATHSTLCHAPLIDFVTTHLKSRHRHGLRDFAAAILHHMPYSPASTSVDTTAAQAFDLKQGVCQDHTHVFLAGARYLGLPARYVSGYLYTADSSHLSTHAWAEVYLDGLWYCFDVSNQLFSLDQHVTLAIGRDYLDAAPVRGSRQGGGEETMQALVKVMQAA